MKKISYILLFAFISVLLLGCGNKRVVQYYEYAPGVIEEEYFINRITRKKTGLYKYYSMEGNLLLESNLLSGKLDGPTIYYCDDGITVLESLNYESGSLDGFVEKFYCETGSLAAKVEYNNGKILTVLEARDIQGKKLFTGDHEEGNGEFIQYDKNGNIKGRFTAIDGILNGYYYMISNTGHVDSFYVENGYCKKLDSYDLRY